MTDHTCTTAGMAELPPIHCPCCGHDISNDDLPRPIGFVSPLMQEIVAGLHRHPGAWTTAYDLAAYVWRDDSDGGPLNARCVLYRAVRRYQSRLRQLGWEVASKQGHAGGYMLRRLERADA